MVSGRGGNGVPLGHLPSQQAWVGLRSLAAFSVTAVKGKSLGNTEARDLKTGRASSDSCPIPSPTGVQVWPLPLSFRLASSSRSTDLRTCTEPCTHEAPGAHACPPYFLLAPRILIKVFFTHAVATLLTGLGRGSTHSTRALLLLEKVGLDCRRCQAAYSSLPSLLA